MSILKKFNETEQTEILEIARFAFEDGDFFDYMVDILDVDDKYMQGLCEKIQLETKGE